MAYQTVTYETRGPVGLLTLNRPERLNAMNADLLGELNAAMDAVEADEQIRALVLTGAGAAFSSGFDLKAQLDDMPEGVAGWRPTLEYDFDTVMRFWRCPKPTIAAVHGVALAGGCELALACDVTIAAEGALFGEPELRFGAGIVVMILPWLTGPKQTKELLLTGNDKITAERALAIGLINRVVPEGGHVEAALAMARDMAVMDPALVAATKRAINQGLDIKGMAQAMQAALDADVLIEGEGSSLRREFTAVAREGGLKAALAWREARFAKARAGET
jgi:enoyl-CoA hydratase